MSDDTTGVQPDAGEKTGGTSGEYTPPASQADLDRIIAARLSREREKFADYDDLKASAARLAEIEEASKTEVQKQAEALAAAEAQLNEYKTRDQINAWKAEVAKATGIPAAALAGSTLEELQAHAETLKSLFPAEAPKRGAIGPYVPGEGSAPSGNLGGVAQDFADALTSQLKR